MSVPELQDALDQISAYDGKTGKKLEDAVRSSTRAIAKDAKRRVPVKSGHLKKRIVSRFDAKTITGYVRAKSPVAHLVEFGAKAALEVPKKQRALRIDEFGIRRFAMKAHIPTRKPKPFLQPAFDAEKPNLVKHIKDAVKP